MRRANDSSHARDRNSGVERAVRCVQPNWTEDSTIMKGVTSVSFLCMLYPAQSSSYLQLDTADELASCLMLHQFLYYGLSP